MDKITDYKSGVPSVAASS